MSPACGMYLSLGIYCVRGYNQEERKKMVMQGGKKI